VQIGGGVPVAVIDLDEIRQGAGRDGGGFLVGLAVMRFNHGAVERRKYWHADRLGSQAADLGINAVVTVGSVVSAVPIADAGARVEIDEVSGKQIAEEVPRLRIEGVLLDAGRRCEILCLRSLGREKTKCRESEAGDKRNDVGFHEVMLSDVDAVAARRAYESPSDRSLAGQHGVFDCFHLRVKRERRSKPARKLPKDFNPSASPYCRRPSSHAEACEGGWATRDGARHGCRPLTRRTATRLQMGAKAPPIG
jgi:hypothetical protein